MNSSLSLYGDLSIGDISEEECCPQPDTNILVSSRNKMNFLQTVDFCMDAFRGKMMIAMNVEILRKMGDENGFPECPILFFNGFLHDGNGRYLDFRDKTPMNLRKVELCLKQQF